MATDLPSSPVVIDPMVRISTDGVEEGTGSGVGVIEGTGVGGTVWDGAGVGVAEGRNVGSAVAVGEGDVRSVGDGVEVDDLSGLASGLRPGVAFSVDALTTAVSSLVSGSACRCIGATALALSALKT
jgi:hypothetical protein